MLVAVLRGMLQLDHLLEFPSCGSCGRCPFLSSHIPSLEKADFTCVSKILLNVAVDINFFVRAVHFFLIVVRFCWFHWILSGGSASLCIFFFFVWKKTVSPIRSTTIRNSQLFHPQRTQRQRNRSTLRRSLPTNTSPLNNHIKFSDLDPIQTYKHQRAYLPPTP